MRQATFSIRKVIQNGYTFYSIYTPAYLSPTGKKHYQYFGTKAEAERKRAELIASTRTESKITDLSNVHFHGFANLTISQLLASFLDIFQRIKPFRLVSAHQPGAKR